MIKIQTITEIRDQILADIETATSQAIPLLPKAIWRILATALAGALSLINRLVQWTRSQIFTQNMDREALILRAAEYGMSPNPAYKWIGEINISGVDDTIILAGVLWQKNGIVYQTKTSKTISGSTNLKLESLKTGSDVDLNIGENLSLVSPMTGVDKTGLVVVVSQSGEDAETTESLRSRVQERERRPPQGGSAADFVGWTREVPGVLKAFAAHTGVGEITVYPLVGTTSEDRIPDSSKLLEIADYVGSIDICPFCVDVIAAAFEIVEFNINITTLNPDTTTNRSAVENSLKQYMLDRFPRQYPDELYPTNYISTAELHKVCFDNGAQSVALSISKIGETSSLTGYTLQDNEVAEIGKIVWPG